ncbi:MAG: UDP-N-acetylmuramate--L-alanine ligase [Chloroflexaceae bacterium]|jgi:UDP-N-acetylmuramate--alanine ligase|nr:UDP-N-acetylmuramate--L-alanine ligase [Chloroflexaceae bacterium]
MRYHIIGIAGAGMSAIANLLLDQGHHVSGSDMSANQQTAALTARGATVFRGHAPDHVAGADVLVATSAVKNDHPEIVAGLARGLPVQRRADLWRDWSQQRPVIAVAGTHGKTTTTAMLALVLTRAGLNPGFLIGGEAPDLGTSARWGDPTAPLIIEADEYDRTFLALRPHIALVTNVEWDHPDIYASEADYHAAFAQFAASVPQQRHLVLCADDAGIMAAISSPESTIYGIDEQLASDPVSCRRAPLDWAASGVAGGPHGTSFDLWHYNRRTFAMQRRWQQQLHLSGEHNVRNALGVIAVANLLQLDPAAVAEGLSTFQGTGRRFELKGEAAGVTVIDDYGHHPTEVRATLAAARARFGPRRIVAYMQPHTYSRTAALLAQWPEACADADLVLVGDVYAAREQGDPAATVQQLVERIAALHANVQYSGSVAASASLALAQLRPGDVLITFGAGDSHRVGELVLEGLGVRG